MLARVIVSVCMCACMCSGIFCYFHSILKDRACLVSLQSSKRYVTGSHKMVEKSIFGYIKIFKYSERREMLI